MQKISHSNDQSYTINIESTLNIRPILDDVDITFDIFAKGYEMPPIDNESDELRYLRKMKVFLHHHQNEVDIYCKNTVLAGHDCLTWAIIACLIGARKGYNVSIGRPDKLSRYLHAVLITSTGTMFKLTGKSTNYKPKYMAAEEVCRRFKYIQPCVRLVNSIRARLSSTLQ